MENNLLKFMDELTEARALHRKEFFKVCNHLSYGQRDDIVDADLQHITRLANRYNLPAERYRMMYIRGVL